MVEEGKRLWKQEDGDSRTNGTFETSSSLNYKRSFAYGFLCQFSVIIIPLVKQGRVLAGTSGWSYFSGKLRKGNSGLDQVKVLSSSLN